MTFDPQSSEYVTPGMKLYKYVSEASAHFEKMARSLIIDSKIWLSSRRDFNDPFDSKPFIKNSMTVSQMKARAEAIFSSPVGFHGTVEEWIKAVRHLPANASAKSLGPKALRKIKEGAVQEHESLLDGMGIFSLSQDPLHPLMWAHYANSHRGVCFRLQPSGSAASTLWFTFRVDYESERPAVDLAKMVGAPSEIRDHSGEYFKSSHLKKMNEWSYEREYRTMTHAGAHQYHAIDPTEVTGVIYGAYCPDDKRVLIDKLIKESGREIKRFETQLSEAAYEIKVKRLR